MIYADIDWEIQITFVNQKYAMMLPDNAPKEETYSLIIEKCEIHIPYVKPSQIGIDSTLTQLKSADSLLYPVVGSAFVEYSRVYA